MMRQSLVTLAPYCSERGKGCLSGGLGVNVSAGPVLEAIVHYAVVVCSGLVRLSLVRSVLKAVGRIHMMLGHHGVK